MFADLPTLPFGFIFDPWYFVYVAPALLLAMYAQMRLSSTYNQTSRMAASMTGAQAARNILDSAGLYNVGIEQVAGHLSDHYDPRARVLRLSPPVYQGNSIASVGIAAHEAGHALQHAQGYAPLAIRNAAVPMASFGSNFAFILFFIGAVFSAVWWLMPAAIVLFSVFVFFQLINLPVEYNASSRAKAQLSEMGIVGAQEMVYVNKVLGAAALTYVAGTLMAVLQLLYLVMRYSGNRN